MAGYLNRVLNAIKESKSFDSVKYYDEMFDELIEHIIEGIKSKNLTSNVKIMLSGTDQIEIGTRFKNEGFKIVRVEKNFFVVEMPFPKITSIVSSYEQPHPKSMDASSLDCTSDPFGFLSSGLFSIPGQGCDYNTQSCPGFRGLGPREPSPYSSAPAKIDHPRRGFGPREPSPYSSVPAKVDRSCRGLGPREPSPYNFSRPVKESVRPPVANPNSAPKQPSSSNWDLFQELLRDTGVSVPPTPSESPKSSSDTLDSNLMNMFESLFNLPTSSSKSESDTPVTLECAISFLDDPKVIQQCEDITNAISSFLTKSTTEVPKVEPKEEMSPSPTPETTFPDLPCLPILDRIEYDLDAVQSESEEDVCDSDDC